MNYKAVTKRILHIFMCAVGKHKIIKIEICGRQVKYCTHCKHTQYMFLHGWGVIKRNNYVQSYIDKNTIV